MRRSIVAGAVLIAVLALAGAALAAFQQHAVITFTAKRAGQSTGLKSYVYQTNSPGAKPKALKLLTMTFPTGTKFNLGSVKACKLTDKQISSGQSCPAASQIGSGSAIAQAYPLPQKINASVKAYAATGGKMVLVVKATKPIPQTLVIRATSVRNNLTIPVPTPTVAGFKVVVISLKLDVPRRGTGRNALITAGACTPKKPGPGKEFVVKSTFRFEDGTVIKNLKSTSPCL